MTWMRPFYLLMLILSVAFAGCTGMEVKKDITNNMLYSEGYPKIKIKINPEIKFQVETKEGEVSPTVSDFVLPVETSNYFFIKSEDAQMLKKIVLISFDEVFNGRWIKQPPKKQSGPKYFSGSMEIRGKNYDYYVGNMSLKKIIGEENWELILKKGYMGSGDFLFKIIQRYASKSVKIRIAYMEDINDVIASQADYKNLPKHLLGTDKAGTEYHRNLYKKFLANSEKNVQIIE